MIKTHKRYEGMTVDDLLYITKENTVKLPIETIDGIFGELMSRYFSNRDFDLYKHIYSPDKMRYFLHTIALELQNEKTDIPAEHTQHYMKGMLNFVDLLQQNTRTISSWSIHEMQGLKDLLEKLNSIKMTDQVFKQRVNLFIADINQRRQKEAEKNEQLMLQNRAEGKSALTNIPHNSALMKEEIKTMNIALSKLNKDDLINVLYNVHLYSDKDKDRIYKTCIKKYEYEAFKTNAAGCVLWCIDNGYDKVDNRIWESAIGKTLHESYGKDTNYDKVISWIDSIEGITPRSKDLYKKRVISLTDYSYGVQYSPLVDDINKKIENSLGILRKRYGLTIKESTEQKVQTISDGGIYNFPLPKVWYENGKWVGEDMETPVHEYNVLQYYNMLYKIAEKLYRHTQDDKMPPHVQEFFAYPSKMKWCDLKDIDLGYGESSIKGLLLTKFKADWTIEETKAFYTSMEEIKYVNDVLFRFTTGTRDMWSISASRLEGILSIWDFSKDEHLQCATLVVNNPHRIHHTDISDYIPIYDKLKKERPHELYAIEEVYTTIPSFTVSEHNTIDALIGLTKVESWNNRTHYGDESTTIDKEVAVKISVVRFFLNKYAI